MSNCKLRKYVCDSCGAVIEVVDTDYNRPKGWGYLYQHGVNQVNDIDLCTSCIKKIKKERGLK